MQLNHTIIYCVIFGLFLSGVLGQVCESTNDCPCGAVCVSDVTTGKCLSDFGCTCKLGCFVFNTFLGFGKDSTLVHGNWCWCIDPIVTKSVPACTLMPWDNNTVPVGVDVYVNNENCI